MPVMRWDVIAKRASNAKTGIEVGVLDGRNASKILRKIPTLFLYMVDRWRAYDPQAYSHEKWRKKFQSQKFHDEQLRRVKRLHRRNPHRAKIVRKDSAAAAEDFEDLIADFVFIDDFVNVWLDIKYWLPKVKIGGWLCGHDYNKTFPGVIKAVKQLPEVELDSDSTWFYKVE